jgi:hypothetical protein
LTKEYKLQILLLKKLIDNVNNPSTIEESKQDLMLRFERMKSRTDSAKSKSFNEGKA